MQIELAMIHWYTDMADLIQNSSKHTPWLIQQNA